MVYAVPVLSTIARGNIVSMDTQAAGKSPGVLAVITRENAPPLFKGGNDYSAACQSGENWMPLQDDEIYYDGQIIGLVVADTLERAVGATELVKTSYQSCRPMVDLSSALKKPDTTQPPTALGQKLQYQRGDVETALSKSAVRIEQTYTTPIQHHNPLEPHASVAEWSSDGRSLTLHETSQWVVNSRNTIARMLGHRPDRHDGPGAVTLPGWRVRLQGIRLGLLGVGGGFGARTRASGQAGAVAPADVQPEWSPARHHSDRDAGCRPARPAEGDAPYERHRYVQGVRVCRAGRALTELLYKCASLQTGLDLARMNTGTPTPMRGPGETPGLFALELAMDELAVATGINPVELRLRNYAERDPRTNNRQPWSSKYLRECYVRGAEEFGWENRPKIPASRRDGRWLIGYGMASATYPAQSTSSDVLVRLDRRWPRRDRGRQP